VAKVPYSLHWTIEMTAKRLLLLALEILGIVIIFTSITGNIHNKFTHDCVANHDQRAFEVISKIYGTDPNEPDQKQRYCKPNYHPVLSKKWETINRYISYTTYAVTTPIILCTGAILVSRSLREHPPS
jgi:hypothetical protein